MSIYVKKFWCVADDLSLKLKTLDLSSNVGFDRGILHFDVQDTKKTDIVDLLMLFWCYKTKFIKTLDFEFQCRFGLEMHDIDTIR